MVGSVHASVTSESEAVAVRSVTTGVLPLATVAVAVIESLSAFMSEPKVCIVRQISPATSAPGVQVAL